LNNLFFDLDGTIINSERGIMKSLKYMYNNTLGYVPHDDDTLRKFIGPTLGASFEKYDGVGLTDPKAKEMFNTFREYYAVDGWEQFDVYDGVPEMLKGLHDAGKEVFIATSKPETFAKQIIDQIGMKPYIHHVFGASDDEETRTLKEDVIAYGIKKTSVDLNMNNLVMVGDRSSDIVGAHKNNLKAIGVTYGFGTHEELDEAHCEWIVNTPQDIVKLAMEK